MTPTRKELGSWLSGESDDAVTGTAGTHAGSRLGLPAEGSGSMARLGRRIGALGVDWALASVISAGFFGYNQWATLGIFAVENFLLVWTLGFSIGHRIFGLKVQMPDGARVPAWRAAVRVLLLCLVVPAVVWDQDGRGLHDKAAGTLIVRL